MLNETVLGFSNTVCCKLQRFWVTRKKGIFKCDPAMTPEKKGFAKSPKGHTLLVTFALSSANFRPRIAARAIFERSGGDATMSTEYFFAKRWTTPFIFLLRHTITIIEVLTFLRNKACKALTSVQNWQRQIKLIGLKRIKIAVTPFLETICIASKISSQSWKIT